MEAKCSTHEKKIKNHTKSYFGIKLRTPRSILQDNINDHSRCNSIGTDDCQNVKFITLPVTFQGLRML